MPQSDSDLRRFLQDHVDVSRESSADVVPQLLRSLRRHLGLQLAFVSRFTGGRRVFQYVDAAQGYERMVEEGASNPLEESYCQRLVDGRLPEVIPDVGQVPEARGLAVTRELSMGSHIGVPIRLSDGSVYGTFCAIGAEADPSLTTRDAQLLNVFADITAQLVEHEQQHRREHEKICRRTRHVLDDDGLSMVYQPIRSLEGRKTVGLEALARFTPRKDIGPDVWFNEAAQVGLGAALETKAIALALRSLERLPPDLYVSCNVSPEVAKGEELKALFADLPLARVVLEITEHATVKDYEDLGRALAPLRERGMRLAVDDAGAGYASFRHILSLRPDIIKLDISLTQEIDSDPGRRALAAALIRFAQETGSHLVAEGVETEAELDMLRSLNAENVQGYLVGRPLDLEGTLRALRAA